MTNKSTITFKTDGDLKRLYADYCKLNNTNVSRDINDHMRKQVAKNKQRDLLK